MIKNFFIVLISFSTILFFSCSNKKKEEAKKYFLEAQKILKEGKGTDKDKIQKAAFNLKRALSLDPDFDEARLFYARVLFYQGNYNQALKEAKYVSDELPKKPIVIALAAASLYELKGDTNLADEALGNLEMAKDKATLEEKYHIGKCLTAGKDKKRAFLGMKIIKEVLNEMENPPSRWEAFYGVALFKYGRKDEAKTHLKKALEDPSVPDRNVLKKLLESIK